MTGRDLSVLRVYHSGVVTPWRRRNEELRGLGVGVRLISPLRWNEGGRDVALVAGSDERVTGVRTFGRHPFRFLYDPVHLLRVLRSERVDVLDVHEEPASIAALEVVLGARLAGLRAPFCLYSAENLPKRYPPPFRWIERFLLRRAAAVHTCNPQAGAILRSKGFSGRVVNLGLGSNFEELSPGPEIAGCETDRPLSIGYVGRFDQRKGVDILLRAVAAVDRTRITLVGDGELASGLDRRVAELGLSDRVTIRGFVSPERLADEYRGFDVLVVPSLTTARWVEQFGRVVVEAQSCGVPVVVSDSGSLPWLVGESGIVVREGDVGSLGQALVSLRDTPALRAELRHAGLVNAQRFSWASIAAQQAALYRTMLRDSVAPGGNGPAVPTTVDA